MKSRKLSVVVAAFNEEKTIGVVLAKIAAVDLINRISKEIIVVNDGSTDDTEGEVRDFMRQNRKVSVKYLVHEQNRGKGAALRTGIANSNGDYIVVQDADLEYDPQEFNLLLKPMEDGFANVVYGSRFQGGRPHRILFFWHTFGNKLLTFFSNMFSNLNLTDMETCYKMFASDVLKSIRLREDRFGFEPEVTAKMARVPGVRVYEIGISYYGRTYLEGKKINWKDGVKTIYCILRYNLFPQLD
jgi:glycosyltransferase involved in cell wall biosynthesis